jgi:Zn-dependent protease
LIEQLLEEIIRQIAVWALPVLFAVVLHEVAHGWVANRLGDPTAARMGRLTLNPIAHIDLFGSILIPLLLIVSNAPFLFGYAKPVPVNFYNLRKPKRDMIWVAAAGPITNLMLALGAVFNSFPLPPLDGGRVLVGLLPEPHSSTLARIEPFGFLILIVLLMTHALEKVVGPPMGFLLDLYFALL